MRMPSELVGANFQCRFTIKDTRTLDEESLLNSPFATDSIFAILTHHHHRPETIRRILERIATLESGRRDDALKKLMILAGLRKMGDAIRAEVKQMPILDDIMDHDFLGPLIRQGRQEGIREGLQEGVIKGELAILRRILGKRFGDLPTWVDDRLTNLSTSELEDLSLRLFEAKSIDELFVR
jgi:predicted transposase YdaD